MVVALLFLMVAALAVLVLSNLSPVTLTVLGAKTLALPLGIWVAGAIGAGAITIVILSGLSRFRAVPASSRRPSPRSANRFTPNAFRTPWSTGTSGRSSTASSTTNASGSRTASQSGNAKAAWDDWEDYQAPASPSASRTQVRDTEDEDWANWEGYEEVQRPRDNRQDSSVRDSGRDDADDDFDFDNDFEDDRRDDRAYREPVRTDFEVRREPQTRQQSGSVYSYSYRQDDQPEPAQPTARPGEVYDADYRVITPPYRPDPEAAMPFPDRPTDIRDAKSADDRFADNEDDIDDNIDDSDDEDWGLDDDPPQPARGDRPGR